MPLSPDHEESWCLPHLGQEEARLLPSGAGEARSALPLPVSSLVKSALSLLLGCRLSAWAPATMARKRLRCSEDFSCDTQSGFEGGPATYSKGITPAPLGTLLAHGRALALARYPLTA